MVAPRWLSHLEIVIECWGPRSEWLFPLPDCYSVVHYFLDRAAEGQALTSDRRVFTVDFGAEKDRMRKAGHPIRQRCGVGKGSRPNQVVITKALACGLKILPSPEVRF
jgi:hypothetical protein